MASSKKNNKTFSVVLQTKSTLIVIQVRRSNPSPHRTWLHRAEIHWWSSRWCHWRLGRLSTVSVSRRSIRLEHGNRFRNGYGCCLGYLTGSWHRCNCTFTDTNMVLMLSNDCTIVQLDLCWHWTCLFHQSTWWPCLLIPEIFGVNSLTFLQGPLFSMVVMDCLLFRLFAPDTICYTREDPIKLCV